MEKKVIFSGAFASEKEGVAVRVPLIFFSEDDNQIVCCPALEVSGYGKTEEEAKQSFETSFSAFFEYTMHKKTITDELKRLGWTIKGKHKPAFPPSMTHLLENNDNFSRIINEHNFRKVDQQIEIPMAC
jgi:hypothetical protein